MGRYDGFAIADVSTALFTDAKMRRLWRRLGDQGKMCQAATIHLAVILASWSEGERVDVDGSLPPWLLPDDEIVAALVAEKLLDRTRRVPRKAWDGYFGPAAARREERREAGRRGGLAKAARSSAEATPKLRPSSAKAELKLSSTRTDPYRTDPTIARARPREGGAVGAKGPSTIGEALAGTPLGEAIAARKSNGG